MLALEGKISGKQFSIRNKKSTQISNKVKSFLSSERVGKPKNTWTFPWMLNELKIPFRKLAFAVDIDTLQGHVIHSFNDRSVGSCLFDSHELKFACSKTLASDFPKHWRWYQRQFSADEQKVENCSERCFVHYFDQKRKWYDGLKHLHQKTRLSQIPWLNG